MFSLFSADIIKTGPCLSQSKDSASDQTTAGEADQYDSLSSVTLRMLI